uniref:ERCC4 domain-containing protein n=1 Tax=Steinernema glaseri TaxID=37863 RepID=A0A1I7YWA4_9BILA
MFLWDNKFPTFGIFPYLHAPLAMSSVDKELDDDTMISIKEEPLSSGEDGEDEYAIQVNESRADDDSEITIDDRTEILPYENNLMVDTMDDDVLFIAARGLGLERLFYLHLHLYSSQKLLVLVINTIQNDEHFFLRKMTESDADCSPIVLNSETSTKDRETLYHQGGVQFVTSRILMVDLLTGRIPVENVSGVLVYRAHTLMTSFQESFILRLLREKKPGIFVKAFTDCPSAIASGGIGQLQRLIDKLYVRRVRIIPRFDVEVKSCFEKDGPKLIEISVDVPFAYRKAMTPLVDIIRTCVKELKQCSHGIETSVAEESNAPWSGVTPSALEIELKQKSLTLSEKQQRLLRELDQLRAILEQLQDLDAVTAYRSFKAIRNCKDLFNTNSGWVFTRTAGKIYTALEDIVTTRNSEGQPVALHPAKWVAFSSVLEEIRDITTQRFTEGNTTPSTVLILTSSKAVCNQIAELLKFGISSMVSHLLKELADDEGKIHEVEDEKPLWEPHRIFIHGIDHRQYKKDRDGMMSELMQGQKKAARDGRKRRAKAQTVKGKNGGAQTLISDYGLVHYKKMRGWNNNEDQAVS